MSQHRRRLSAGRRARRSIRAFLVTTVAAALGIGFGARYLLGHYAAPRVDALANVVGQIPTTKSAAKLVQERQNLVLAAVASKSFKMISSPKVSQASGGGGPVLAFMPPNAATAQHIAYVLMSQAPWHFNPKTQYPCLDSLWTRESNWTTTSENKSSGAYGIPQALPGDKMAPYGSDWRTNPKPQIEWGLSYIKGRYGSPCGAWDHSQATGWY